MTLLSITGGITGGGLLIALGWFYGYDEGFREAASLRRPRIRIATAIRARCGPELWIAAPSDSMAAEVLIASTANVSVAPKDGGRNA